MVETGDQALDLMKAAVARGMISPDQLRECLSLHSQTAEQGTSDRLVDVVLRMGYLSPDQVKALQAEAEPPAPRIPGYEIESLLGRGGMGCVYKARETRGGRIVALKVLNPDLSRQKHLTQRFLRESRAATQIAHPNVVTAFDAGEAGGVFYYAMEFVEGIAVDEMVRRQKCLEERVALDIARQIALGLDALHQMKIVHRDVKPQNIMVSKNGVAKLCDLGLARFEAAENSSLTATGTILGTPFYISPEQIKGAKDIDTRSDVYNLGGTLFAMLTGRPPYVGESPMAIVAKHMKEPVPDPRKYKREVSEAAAQVVMKCMRKNREERYRTGRELAEAIDGILAPRPRPSTRITRHSTIRYVTGRHSSRGAPAGAIVTAVVILLLGGGFVMMMGNRTTRVRPTVAPVPPVGEDSVAKELFEALKAAAGEKQWDRIKKEAPKLLSEHSDSPTIKANRSTIEGWLSDAAAADRARVEEMAAAVASARGLFSGARWAEAASAIEEALKKYGGRLGADEAPLRADLATARREVESAQAVAAFDLIPGDRWQDRRLALERIQSEFGQTQAVRAREAEWVALAQALKKEQEAADRLAAAELAVEAKDWKKADETIGALSASLTGTSVYKTNQAKIQALSARIDQARSADTEERVGQLLAQAAAAFRAKEWSKARDWYVLARSKYGASAAFRAQESEINGMIARCEEQLSGLAEDQAIVALARANMEFRDRKWAAALQWFDRALKEFGGTEAVKKKRPEIDARRADCEKNRKDGK